MDMNLFKVVKDILIDIIPKAAASNTASSKFEYLGEKYYIMYIQSRDEVCLWAQDGATVIYTGKKLPGIDQAILACVEAIENWQYGKMKCRDCGKLINYSENSQHRCFAGIYCQHCWDTKWKEIESKETYN